MDKQNPPTPDPTPASAPRTGYGIAAVTLFPVAIGGLAGALWQKHTGGDHTLVWILAAAVTVVLALVLAYLHDRTVRGLRDQEVQ